MLHEIIGTPAMLEQTAEECVEMAHACLKMARYMRGENKVYKTIGHHFGFHGLRVLKTSYVSIVALFPCPAGLGDSLYRFISKI